MGEDSLGQEDEDDRKVVEGTRNVVSVLTIFATVIAEACAF